MRPWDKHPTEFATIIGPLLDIVEQITDLKVIPNERIATIKQPPFISYYPLVIDDPVFGDPTFNNGLFEATISLDVFANTINSAMQTAGDLRVYLFDMYTRQLLRRDAHLVVREATTPQTRSITGLPFKTVHHTGFDLTIQYYRNFKSPIDTINSVADLTINPNKEDQ